MLPEPLKINNYLPSTGNNILLLLAPSWKIRMVAFLKSLSFALVDIHELLRVAVHQRKPAALDLDHQPVALLKGVRHIGKFVFNTLYFIGLESFGLLKTIAETAAHHLATNQHLVTADRVITTAIAAHWPAQHRDR